MRFIIQVSVFAHLSMPCHLVKLARQDKKQNLQIILMWHEKFAKRHTHSEEARGGDYQINQVSQCLAITAIHHVCTLMDSSFEKSLFHKFITMISLSVSIEALIIKDDLWVIRLNVTYFQQLVTLALQLPWATWDLWFTIPSRFIFQSIVRFLKHAYGTCIRKTLRNCSLCTKVHTRPVRFSLG